MSLTFRAKYEFDIDRHKSFREIHTVICAEGNLGSDGEGSVRFWIEKHSPSSFDFETGEYTPERTETIQGRTIYSYDLITKRSKSGVEYKKAEAPWLLRQHVLSIARGDVGAASAAEILWLILARTCVQSRDTWLVEGAPEWFALVDPKREEVKA